MKADRTKQADKMLRTPKCSRCRNHGFLVPVKGHAGKCRWKQCTCEKCYLIAQRQKIMAAQKVLKKQAPGEEQEVALGAQGPQVASGSAAANPGPRFYPLPPLAVLGDAQPGPSGQAAACFPERPPRGWSPGTSAFQPILGGRNCGHMGLSEHAARARPSSLEPQLAAEATGRGYPGCLELRRPPRPVPSPLFADFGLPLSINSDSVVRSEYLEREPPKLYPGCSSMHPYGPFPLGYQGASPAAGPPLQQGFGHVSYGHYNGGGLVADPMGDFQPSYYPPPAPSQQPQFLPPGFLSALHFFPPPPPPPPPPSPPASFSLTILSDTDKENTDDQDVEEPIKPSQSPDSQQIKNDLDVEEPIKPSQSPDSQQIKNDQDVEEPIKPSQSPDSQQIKNDQDVEEPIKPSQSPDSQQIKNDQDMEGPIEPSQPSSQEQSD